jgi:hypothetical protein
MSYTAKIREDYVFSSHGNTEPSCTGSPSNGYTEDVKIFPVPAATHPTPTSDISDIDHSMESYYNNSWPTNAYDKFWPTNAYDNSWPNNATTTSMPEHGEASTFIRYPSVAGMMLSEPWLEGLYRAGK